MFGKGENLVATDYQMVRHPDIHQAQYLPRKSPAHSASVLRVSADGHGVSGSHNQNDWLVA
ncbi:hypothetical protein OkiPb00131_15010 [Escherichia coli]